MFSHAKHRLRPNLNPHLRPKPNLSLSRRINHHGIRYGHVPMFHTRLSSVTAYRQDTGVITHGACVIRRGVGQWSAGSIAEGYASTSST